MFSKIIFVLATVCVINASVITDIVNDENPESEVAANPKSCNWQACDQLCRRLKFPSGTCVNGRCKCDNFLNAEDGVEEKPFTDLEDSVSLQDDPATEFAAKPSRCYLKLCNLLCRKLNNTSGACVDGRCKCEKANKPEVYEELLSNPEDSVLPRACNNQKCNQLCRKKKFRGGACLGPNCYCNKFFSQQDDAMTDPAEELSLSNCNSIACDDHCRRTGWHSGVCINGQCKCDYFLNTADAVPEPLSDVEDSVTPKRCTQEACNVLCRKLKFQEGVCIASRCRCKNYTPLQQDAMTELEESLLLQNDFFSDDFVDTEDEVLENPLPVSELSEDQTERSCNMRACEQLCRRLKFPGGACVNGRCKCDNFFRTEDADAVDEYLELAPRRVCRIRQCNRTCTRRGYERARCVNGLCKCFNKIQKDPALYNEVINEDQEDSNLVVKTNEEELDVSSARSCSPVTCREKCRFVNLVGGWCFFGLCMCL